MKRIQLKLVSVSNSFWINDGWRSGHVYSPVILLFVDDADQDLFSSSSQPLPTGVPTHQSEMSPLSYRSLLQTCDHDGWKVRKTASLNCNCMALLNPQEM